MAKHDDMHVFGQRLKSVRKRRGWSQAQLAKIVGCSRGYLSSLETGSFSPSMSVLRKLADALNVKAYELLYLPGSGDSDAIPVLNTTDALSLPSPDTLQEQSGAGSTPIIRVPGVMGREAFAAYLADDAMAPEFCKGDLIVFSLTRQAMDGDACLVHTGKQEVVFRTVLSLPGRMWRLQPKNPRYEPVTIKVKPNLRMWPAIGTWQLLAFRTRRQKGTA